MFYQAINPRMDRCHVDSGSLSRRYLQIVHYFALRGIFFATLQIKFKIFLFVPVSTNAKSQYMHKSIPDEQVEVVVPQNMAVQSVRKSFSWWNFWRKCTIL